MEQRTVEQLLDWIRNHYFGKYRGTVTDNDDQTHRGRVKVNVPAVLADQEVWAMPCMPYTGDGVGSFWIPEPGAGVWVEFEGGDPSYPVWTGGFWADNEIPSDQNGSAATPALRILRSQKGLMVSLDDDNQAINLSDQNGSNILTIDVQNDQINITATSKVVIQANNIQLVPDSTHPLVFGDQLQAYLVKLATTFSTHTHMCPTPAGPAPSSPPTPTLTAPTPDKLLSSTVTTG